MGSLGQAVLDLTADPSKLKQNLDQSHGIAQSWTQKTQSFLSSAGSTMLGVFGANLVQTGIGAINQLFSQGLDVATKYQGMYFSLNAMIEQELIKGQTKTITVMEKRNALDKKQAKELANLKGENFALDQAQLKAMELNIRQAEQKLATMKKDPKKYGALDIQEQQNNIQVLRLRYKEASDEIVNQKTRLTELTGKTSELVAVQKEITVGAMTKEEAAAAAGTKVADLLDWLQEVAIYSTYTRQQLGESIRQLMVYGFNTTDAKKATQSLTDFGAATGRSAASIDLIVYALGQMNQTGKINSIDMRQLANQGVPVWDLLSKALGRTVKETTDLDLSSAEVRGTVKKMIEELGKMYEGKARQLAISLPGLVSSFRDLAEINLSNFFIGRDTKGGVFGPLLNDLFKIVEFFANPGNQKAIEAFGKKVGEWLAPKFKAFIDFMQVTAFPVLQRLSKWMTETAMQLFGWQSDFQDLGKTVQSILQNTVLPIVRRVGTALAAWFQRDGIAAIQNGFRMINAIVTGLDKAFQSLSVAYEKGGMGAVLAKAVEMATSGLAVLWGRFWNWMSTTVAPQIPTMLTKLLDGALDFLTTSAPKILAKLGEWSAAFFKWLTDPVNGGIVQMLRGLNQLADSIVAWLSDPNTKIKLAQFSDKIGENISGGIQLSFKNEKRMEGILGDAGLIGGILTIIPKLGAALILLGAELGYYIGRGVVQGMLRAIDAELRSALKMEGEGERFSLLRLIIGEGQYNQLIGKRAGGGPVLAGRGYMVGERGPEPFIPATNGWIFPSTGALQTALATNTSHTTTAYISVYGDDPVKLERQIRRIISRGVRR